jgi:tRNA threonylcarbamoyladenosine biosynthesis protein TsaE
VKPPTVRAATDSPRATRALAAKVAESSRGGDIIVLAGDLGTGKTVWVQGYADGLGVTDGVTSPTFTIVRPHEGRRLRLLHADLYRLDRLGEVMDLGLIEQLDDRTVACIEWGDLATAALPADLLEVRLDYGLTDESRTLVMTAVGAAWRERLDELAIAVSPWVEAQ